MTTILVTGAARGIGLELCRQLQARGDTVIAVCRSPTEALTALGVRVIAGIDVTDGPSVARLAQELGGQRLDVLVNNAGIMGPDSFGGVDYDGMLEQYRVNALGPLRVTETLAGHLGDGAKVVIVTSRMGSIADNSSGGRYGYRASKAAVNQIGASLAHDLRDRGVSVALLHPGMVATDLTGHRGIAVEDAARGLIERIDALSPETSGSFWHAEGQVLPW